MKPFDLYINEEFKQRIRDGASHCVVEYYEGEHGCTGTVTQVGDEKDLVLPHSLVIVPKGFSAHAAIWETSEIKGLL